VKVRKDQKTGDYSDPGWFQHPKGTVARKHEECSKLRSVKCGLCKK